MNLDIFLIIISSVFLGISINRWWVSINAIRKLKKEKKKKDSRFVEILQNLKSNPAKAKFKNRVNDVVYIETEILDYNKVVIVYNINKNDITIFKNEDCLLTSDGVERNTIDEIITSIINNFSNQINDVITVLGITFGRQEFEKSFGMKSEDIRKLFYPEDIKNDSEIDKIYFENEMKFDIDEILDRINMVGIKNLTTAELEFLRKWGNEKRN